MYRYTNYNHQVPGVSCKCTQESQAHQAECQISLTAHEHSNEMSGWAADDPDPKIHVVTYEQIL